MLDGYEMLDVSCGAFSNMYESLETPIQNSTWLKLIANYIRPCFLTMKTRNSQRTRHKPQKHQKHYRLFLKSIDIDRVSHSEKVRSL